MILPTKHISPEKSLLGVGAVVLKALREPCTISELWEEVKNSPGVGSFSRLVLALDLLYIMGAIELESGLLHSLR